MVWMDDGAGEQSAVDSLMVGLLERVEDSGSSVDEVLEELCSEHPHLAPDLRASVRVLVDTGLLPPSGGSGTPRLPEEIGGHRLLARLGGGGMGVVYEAEDAGGRRVALKILRPAELAFGNMRARFRREVQAASRLAHPGIVSVFAMGEEHGIPYLAMELVRGCTLARAMDRQGRRAAGELTGADLARAVTEEARRGGEDGPFVCEDDLFDGSWSEACLRVVRRVAEALEHAHGRGVLHRDVKPANVMITPEGRVVLLDFGLAAVTGADRLTRTGAEIGSLPYMAPEQIAEGEGDVGRRTDVYQLGVTLYELLTLRAPFLDPSSRERTRRRVLEGRPARPRRIVPGIPADAEAVCLAAMDRDPDRRHGSAGALAGDLTNVLEGRRVDARPAGALVHLARLARRHKGAAAAIVLALLGVTVVPGTLAFREAQARIRIRDGYTKALQAVELLTRTASEELAEASMSEAARRRVLGSAVGFLQEIDPWSVTDESLQAEMVRARLELASLLGDLGRPEQGREVARALVDVLREKPTSMRRLASRAHSVLARQLRHLTDMEGSLRELRAARELLGKAADREDLRLAARIELGLGALLNDLDRGADGQEHLAHARTMLGELVAEDPTDRVAAHDLAEVLLQVGLAAAGRRDFAQAEADFEAAAELCRAAVDAHPQDRRLRAALLRSLANVASARFFAGRATEAAECMEEAAALAEDLVEEYPLVHDNHRTRARMLSNLAALRGHLGEDVRDVLERALAAQQEIVERFRLEEDRWAQAFILENLAGAHFDEPARRLESMERAIALAEEALAVQPGDPNFQRCLHTMRSEHPEALAQLGRCEDALAALADVPEPLGGRAHLVLARVLASCGETGDTAAGEETVARSLEHLERALEMGYDDPAGLREDPLLATLRDRPAFEALVGTWEER